MAARRSLSYRRGFACVACLFVMTACFGDDDDAFPDDGYGEGQVGAFQPALCSDPTEAAYCTRANSCAKSLLLNYQGYCAPTCGSGGECPSGSTCVGYECWLTCSPSPVDSCPAGFLCGLEVDAGPMLTCFAQSESGVGGLLCTSAYSCPSGQTCRPYPYSACAPNDPTCSTGSYGATGAWCACSPGPPNVKCESWCRVGAADCAAGTTCAGFSPPIAVGGVEIGTCRTDCDPASNNCPGGQSCIVDSAATDCEWTCDLTDQSTCGSNSNQSCIPVEHGSDPAYTMCQYDGCVVTDVGDDDCGDPVDVCEPTPSTTAWCVIGSDGGCGSGTCQAMSPPVVVEGIAYGACQ